MGPPGRSRFGQERQSQSRSSRPPSAPTAPSSRDRMQTLEGRQAPPGAPGADLGWSPREGARETTEQAHPASDRALPAAHKLHFAFLNCTVFKLDGVFLCTAGFPFCFREYVCMDCFWYH